MLSGWRYEDPLDDSVLQELVTRCHNLKRLTAEAMYNLSDANRVQLAEKVASILTLSSTLEYVELHMFTDEYKTSGEGNILLEALGTSPSLSQLTYFSCQRNDSWFY